MNEKVKFIREINFESKYLFFKYIIKIKQLWDNFFKAILAIAHAGSFIK